MSTPFSSIGNHPFIAPLGPPQGGPPQGMPGLFTLGNLPHNMPGPQTGGDLAEPWLGGSGGDVGMVMHLPQDFPELPEDDDGLPAQRGMKRSHEGDGYSNTPGSDIAEGPRRKRPSLDKSGEFGSANADAELRWAMHASLASSRGEPSKARPVTEALCDKVARPKWDTPLNGKSISRKDGDGQAQDLRHVVAYETMQSAVHAVLRAASTDQENYDTLEELATVMDQVPTGKDPGQRALGIAKNLNNLLFTCKGNFFLGDALENQRAGSSTAALHHTEERRLTALATAKDVSGIADVLGEAAGSLSGPILDHALEAFHLEPLGSRPAPQPGENPKTVEKQYDASKAAAQSALASSILESLEPLLAQYRAATDPEQQFIMLTLVKNEVAEIIEGLADSTGYDASRTAHAELLEKQKGLPEAFALFRTAERTGDPKTLVQAVQIMKALDDAARDMAPEVLARKNGTAMKPSFGPLYQQPNQ